MFKVQNSRFKIQGSKFKVQSSRSKVKKQWPMKTKLKTFCRRLFGARFGFGVVDDDVAENV